MGRGNPARLHARDKPLKGKPWTWQRDETSPQRRLAEQTVEDVGNVGDGT